MATKTTWRIGSESCDLWHGLAEDQRDSRFDRQGQSLEVRLCLRTYQRPYADHEVQSMTSGVLSERVQDAIGDLRERDDLAALNQRISEVEAELANLRAKRVELKDDPSVFGQPDCGQKLLNLDIQRRSLEAHIDRQTQMLQSLHDRLPGVQEALRQRIHQIAYSLTTQIVGDIRRKRRQALTGLAEGIEGLLNELALADAALAAVGDSTRLVHQALDQLARA